MNDNRKEDPAGRPPLVIIAGATGVGKTELSVELAKQINGQIISADSMQVYRRMDIGTAKIAPHEMRGVKHYLIDEFEPDEECNVFTFKRLADGYRKQILAEGAVPILVGGTGFYIQSVLYDIDFSRESAGKDYRAELETAAVDKGAVYLHEQLRRIDPASAEAIHPNNIKRVIRALEFYHETGERISEHNEAQREKASPYNAAYFVLNRERKTIYDRIERRVDKMMEEGLEQEVRSLLEEGVSPAALSMQGLGYKELVGYLAGDYSRDEAVELLKKNTRHFAKRQITWFKREPDAIWLDYEVFPGIPEMLAHILQILKEKGIVQIP